jgi:hypothetical protein
MDGVGFKTEADETIEHQVNRILESRALRSSESLRRLLRYLAQKTISGEADQLKEYVVAIEGLGKPDSYDPRQESAVRIQVGRLRQKLAEYYQSEGKDDPVEVSLPRGHFRLHFESRCSGGPIQVAQEAIELPPPAKIHRHSYYLLVLALLVALGWACYSTTEWMIERKDGALLHRSWTPEVSALWDSFVSPERPLIVAIQNWPFADVPGFGLFWSFGANTWDEMMQTPATAAVRKLYGNVPPQPYDFMTSSSAAMASFRLGGLLSPRIPSISVVRFADFTWQQLVGNNVIYLGGGALFDEKLRSLPTELEFLQAGRDIRVLHPRPGEPALLSLPAGDPTASGNARPRSIREAYALVTNVSGPENMGVVRTFTSPTPSPRAGALASLTDPAVAREIWTKMKDASGRIPQNFQLVLRMKYRDGIITRTEYVTHRVLNPKESPSH